MFLYYILIRPLEILLEVVYNLALKATFNYGYSIILLSFVINILILPLYNRADELQSLAAKREKGLSTWVKHIKKSFSGDERFMVLSAYYKEKNYSVFSQLQGILPLVIEIPFFIAAYHFLSGFIDLPGNSFGPIRDLGVPDRMFSILGVTVNLLPILMTVINLFSAMVYSEGLTGKKKVQLFLMAAVFLVLLYQSPSGLVLYWTMNNVFSLLKNIFYKLKGHPTARYVMVTGCAYILMIFAAYLRAYGRKRLIYMAAITCCIIGLTVFYYLKRNGKIRFKFKVSECNATDRVDYWLGIICLTLLTGLLIPTNLVGNSPLEFINLGSPFNPMRYIGTNFLLAVGTFCIWISVYYLLWKDRVNNRILALQAVLIIVAAINYMFFGKNYGTISADLRYDSEPVFANREIIINLTVIAAVAVVSYFIMRYRKIRRPVYISVVAAMIIMCAVNIININGKYSEFEKYYDPDKAVNKKIIHLSTGGKNVMVIMLDKAVGLYIPFLTAEKPEIITEFDGFTWYPNTIAHGTKTFLGAPGLYGGYEYTPAAMNKRTDMRVIDKHNEALKMMPRLFSEHGYGVTVLDPPYGNYQEITDLTIFDDLEGVDAYRGKNVFSEGANETRAEFIKYNDIFRYSIFRIMPVAVQKYTYDNGYYFDQISSNELYIGNNGPYMLCHITEAIEISDNKDNNFFLMDNELAHNPLILTKPDYILGETEGEMYHPDDCVYDNEGNSLDLSSDDKEGTYDMNMYAMLCLGKLFEYMRENDVYDNTRIIIVSDHGAGLKQFDDIGVEKSACLLMYKDFNSHGDLNSDNTFMTNADTPTLAVEGLIENPVNPYTGNPINSNAKSEPQNVFEMPWHLLNDNDAIIDMDEGHIWSVEEDIFDQDNWEIVK